MPTTNELIENFSYCTVVSLVPFPLNEYKPGLVPGHFHIPESDTIEPQILHTKGARHHVYLDESRGSLPVENDAARIAASVVNDFIDGQLAMTDSARPGIFWIPGRYSVKEIKEKFQTELKLATIRQNKWFQAICKLADDDWKRYQKHNVVSDNQRKAAAIMNYKAAEHPWMSMDDIGVDEKCFACKVRVDRDALICPNCKSDLKNKILAHHLGSVIQGNNVEKAQHNVIG